MRVQHLRRQGRAMTTTRFARSDADGAPGGLDADPLGRPEPTDRPAPAEPAGPRPSRLPDRWEQL